MNNFLLKVNLLLTNSNYKLLCSRKSEELDFNEFSIIQNKIKVGIGKMMDEIVYVCDTNLYNILSDGNISVEFKEKGWNFNNE